MVQSTSAMLIPDDANNWHPSSHSVGNTDVASHRQVEWTSRRPRATVAESRRFDTTKEIRSAVSPTQTSSVTNKVAGTVLSIEDSVVESEVEFQGKLIRIQLQRSIFPASVKYGTPFFLELIEEDGVRKPKILPRNPDTQKHEAMRTAARKIIDSL